LINDRNAGFIGLGAMGSRIAVRLLEQGCPLLVHDSDARRTLALGAHGAETAASVAEVARACETVILSLPHPRSVEAVVGALLAHGRPGLRIVDMSTVGPSLIRTLSTKARERGIWLIDAPVSGGPARAQTGELSIMVGGDDEAVRAVWPILALAGKHPIHLGASGSGSLAKLVNNFAASWNMLGVSQAFVLATRLGLPLDKLCAAMAAGSAQSYSLARNYPKISQEDYTATFSLELGAKDLFLAFEAADEAGLHLLAQGEVRELVERLLAQGLGASDLAILHKGVEAAMSEALAPKQGIR